MAQVEGMVVYNEDVGSFIKWFQLSLLADFHSQIIYALTMLLEKYS